MSVLGLAPAAVATTDVPLAQAQSTGLYSSLLPTFSFGGTNPTVNVGAGSGSNTESAGTFPNYSVYPGASTTANLSGSFPYVTGDAGDPGPVDG